jgi:hypothetical protein
LVEKMVGMLVRAETCLGRLLPVVFLAWYAPMKMDGKPKGRLGLLVTVLAEFVMVKPMPFTLSVWLPKGVPHQLACMK